MSLGDYLRHVRATRGGDTPSVFYEGLPPEHIRRINEIELRYSDYSAPEHIAALAAHLSIPEAELQWHRVRTRKALSFYLCACQARQTAATFTLRTGEVLTGHVVWWDMGAIGVERTPGQVTVVQRHHVVDWPGAGDTDATA